MIKIGAKITVNHKKNAIKLVSSKGLLSLKNTKNQLGQKLFVSSRGNLCKYLESLNCDV